MSRLLQSAILRSGVALALGGLVTLTGVPAHAQNLVKNGGFEQADPGSKKGTDNFTAASPFDSSWAVTGTVGIDTDNTYIFAGDKSLYLNDGFGMDAVSQNLATTPGQNYTLSFYADSDYNVPLTVNFGGQVVGGAPISVARNGFAGPALSNAGLFAFYSYNVTAASPFTALSFSAVNTAGTGLTTLELDNIQVVPAAPVPEASTTVSLGLLLLGLGGLAIAARKKSRSRISNP